MVSSFGGSLEAPGEGSPVSRARLDDDERRVLRSIAFESIRRGLEEGRALDPDLDAFPEVLLEWGAAFVTLEIDGGLRGCVGSFEPRYPLVQDVARNAYAAAFLDHRFTPLTETELPRLDLHISLLSPLEPLPAGSREDLLARLRPGIDGLLLEDPPHRAIFLPQVWESLPDPVDFFGELLLKAGLSRRHWSDNLRFYRYSVEEF
jgi:AmmeMemoRadiSam system protein A